MVVNNELEKIWRKVVVAYFEVISQSLPGGTEEDKSGLSGVTARIRTGHLLITSHNQYHLRKFP
jgi:hypothetical protein